MELCGRIAAKFLIGIACGADLACSARRDDATQLAALVTGLEAAGHPTKSEELFGKLGQDEIDRGRVLREAQELLLELQSNALFTLMQKPWAEWTTEDWKVLQEDVARCEPAYKMIEAARRSAPGTVTVSALCLAPLARALTHKALLAAHRAEWKIVREVLESQLKMAASVSARAETACISRAGVVWAFFNTARSVEGVTDLPAAMLRQTLESALADAATTRCDLVFEAETLAVWALESEEPLPKKVEMLSAAKEILTRLDREGLSDVSVLDDLPTSGLPEQVRRISRSDSEARAMVQLVRVGLAVLAYQGQTGRWPADLEDVAGLFEGKLPVDPLTGGPFEYERVENGVRIRTRVAKTVIGAINWELRDR